MEFLLFLCAALSALSGAITGARAPAIEVQIERVSAQAGTRAPATARAVATAVQAQPLPALAVVRAVMVPSVSVLAAAIPVFGERRRE